jgi:hypothetical protein
MKAMALVLVALTGCYETAPMIDSAPECDDGDSCTYDYCNSESSCMDGVACGHLPLDLDGDGYATAEGECAGRGEPWTDCNDNDLRIHPWAVELCDPIDADYDCDGRTTCADLDCVTLSICRD